MVIDVSFVSALYFNRIEQFVKAFQAHGVMVAPGAPEEMVDGPADVSGWVPWKPVDSPVTRDDIKALEEQYEVVFPPLFKAYFMYKCLLMTDFGIVELPMSPNDNPLGDLRNTLSLIDEDPYFKRNGFVPFAHDSGDIGPICFDVNQSTEDGDYAIVLLDHHLIGTGGYKGEVEWESFGELLNAIEAIWTENA